MIRNSFCILKGIGERLEKRLWQSGIYTWDDFIRADSIESIPIDTKVNYDLELLRLMEKLEQANVTYLYRAIKRREQWRLYDVFRNGSVCLDIETNGLRPEAGGYVTMVGIYKDQEYHCLIRGFDLSQERLKTLLRDCKYLITFNGQCFDIPFLRKTFRELPLEMPHFDLSIAARRVGLKGGLKDLERHFHIGRHHLVSGMNGLDAVRLWKQWQSGNERSLELLIEYNRADTINLRQLADALYPLLVKSTGFNG